MNQYEAMFLFDPTFGATFENCEEEVRRLLDRAEAEIIICRKWDERRLAYRIKGRKRGVYVLVYFMALPDKIRDLERDAKISENILRLLVVRADGVSRELMERFASAHGEEAVPVATAEPPAATAPATPVATAAETPTVTAAETPAETPTVTAAETPAETPTVTDAETSAETDAPLPPDEKVEGAFEDGAKNEAASSDGSDPSDETVAETGSTLVD